MRSTNLGRYCIIVFKNSLFTEFQCWIFDPSFHNLVTPFLWTLQQIILERTSMHYIVADLTLFIYLQNHYYILCIPLLDFTQVKLVHESRIF